MSPTISKLQAMSGRAAIGLVAALLYVGATVPYIRAAARHSVQPNLVAWGGGAVINTIAFAAQLSKEPSWSAALAAVTACYCAVIVVLTWRNGDRSLDRFDVVCLVLGAGAIIAWQLSDIAEVALGLSVAADVALCAPMVAKTKRLPSSEIPAPFLIAACAAALSATSATHFDAVSLTWPCWLFVINGLIGVLALRAGPERGLVTPSAGAG